MKIGNIFKAIGYAKVCWGKLFSFLLEIRK
jgi:hypothetical protein